jgi:hypothetical protein
MRINRFLIGSTIVLGMFVGCNTPQSDGLEALRSQYDFAVADTASITKIIIQDKTPERVELRREGKQWVVGEASYPVRKDAIEVLLQTLSGVVLKNFVKESAIEQIEQRMNVYGKWVEVYSGETLVKHFVVGTETPDMLGTYYKKVGAELPFAVYIQGFNGYLTTRFITQESLWRDRTIFGKGPEQLASIELYFPGNPSQGWTLTRKMVNDKSNLNEPATAAASWTLVGGEFEALPVKRTEDVLQIINSIRSLKYEGAIVSTDNIWEKKDSIFASSPAFELHVEDVEGNRFVTKAYFKKAEVRQMGADGVPHAWDPDRFYAELPDGRMVLIQQYGWRNVLKTRFDFAD